MVPINSVIATVNVHGQFSCCIFCISFLRCWVEFGLLFCEEDGRVQSTFLQHVVGIPQIHHR